MLYNTLSRTLSKKFSEERIMPALIFEKRNQIAWLTLNRPEVHNSLNPEMLVSLAAAWKEIEKDDGIRATIVTGAGKVAFSAGADLGKLIPLFTGARKPEDEWDRQLVHARRICASRPRTQVSDFRK